MRRLALVGLVAACAPGVEPAWETQALRPDDPAEPLPRYEVGDVVESVVSPSGAFRVHFTRAGIHAVAAADVGANGIPDAAELVASTYDDVLAAYEELGFRAPLADDIVTDGDGGDDRFDVYLVDFAGRADGAYRGEACTAAGACAGYMAQENDFFGYGYPSFGEAVRILASHELFHAVQAAYRPAASVVLSEGTATWASEQFDPTLGDFEAFAGAYLARPDRSLAIDPGGPVPAFAYGSAIFYQFISERFAPDAVRGVFERTADDEALDWPTALDRVLRDDFDSSFVAAFLEFAAWNVATGSRAASGAGYAAGAGYPAVASEELALPASKEVRVSPAAARYYRMPGAADLRWAYTADEGATAVQVLAFSVSQGVVTPLGSWASGATGTAETPDEAELWLALVHPDPAAGGVNGSLCVATGDTCGTPAPEPGDDDDGGCRIAAAPRAGGAPWALIGLLAAVLCVVRSRHHEPDPAQAHRADSRRRP